MVENLGKNDEFVLISLTYNALYAKNRIDYVGDYFPYGKILREFVNGDRERYLTTQHERDEETGLDYRGARYYDADIARFLSLDPLAADFASWSPYNYVMGNPIKFVDKDGRSPEEPDKTKKTDPAKITANYFGLRRSLIGGNVKVNLYDHFGFIQPFNKTDDVDRFSPDEPSSYLSMNFSFADNRENLNLSVGAFRNHTKGTFILEGTDTGKVHWGKGNSQIGVGVGIEGSTPSFVGFNVSGSGFLGAGPQLTRLQVADVTPSNWGIRGIGVVGVGGLHLNSPKIGGVFSASLSVNGLIHYSRYNEFSVSNPISGTTNNYSGLNVTTAGFTTTVQLKFDL